MNVFFGVLATAIVVYIWGRLGLRTERSYQEMLRERQRWEFEEKLEKANTARFAVSEQARTLIERDERREKDLTDARADLRSYQAEEEFLRKHPGSLVRVRQQGDESANGSYLAVRELVDADGAVLKKNRFGRLVD